MRPTPSWRTARRCRSTTRAGAGSPWASRARWRAGRKRSSYGTMSLARGAAGRRSRSRARGSSSTRRSSTRRRRNADFFDDIPATAALYLDPDGTPHDVGTVFRNPDLARAYARIAHLGPKGLYRGAIADAIVNTVQHPPLAPTAEPRLAARRHDDARPARLRRAGARADARQLPRARRLLDGPAFERRLDRRRGAEHPRGLRPFGMPTATQAYHYFLEASRYSFADRNAYLADPDYFDVPLTGLLSKDYAAERRALITDDGRDVPGPARRPVPVQRRPAGLRDGDAVGDDDAPDGRPTSEGTSSPTRSRSSPPAATASSCRAGASCSTTS